MKHTLKGWLADNAVTADNKTDKILLLETAGSMNLDDILEEMYETNAVLRGVQVNTGLFYAVAKFLGVIEGGKWDPEKNSVYIALTQGRELREEIAETAVSILGEKANVMYILETEDRKSGRRDGSATADKNFFVRGAMLKVMGDDPAVGVTLTDSKGIVTKIDDDDITINKPSELTLLLPTGLEDGEYTLTVTTQYSKGNVSLKSPRSASTQVWIGGKPDSGGGEDDRPGEL